MMHNVDFYCLITLCIAEYMDVMMKQLCPKMMQKISYYPKLISGEIYLARTDFNKLKPILHFITGLLRAFPRIKFIAIIQMDVCT